ncbi:MAG: RNA polymerase factor sigma-54, partial [Syntrophothermus sp.]
MRLEQGLSLQQTQKLVLTAELRQAITILQLSAVELTELVEKELLENPVLDCKDTVCPETPEAGGGAEEAGGVDGEDGIDGVDGERIDAAGRFAEGARRKERKERAERLEFDPAWQEYFADRSDLGIPREAFSASERNNYENFVAWEPSLQEHLMSQLRLSCSDGLDRIVGTYLIGSIDRDGYLRCTIEEASEQTRASKERVTRVLGIIQGFDPPGVAARSVQECLKLQLSRQGKLEDRAARLIDEFLPELAEGKLTRVAEKMECTCQEVQAIYDQIRSLDPKPGRNFGGGQEIRYIIPDVVVEKVGADYAIVVSDVSAPRLSINPFYQGLLAKRNVEDAALRFVHDKFNSALWLIRSIEQRRQTIYRVTESIIKKQRAFLEKGVKFLQPMTLRDVAEDIGVHESTVSRATAGKYVQTPQGIFELKFFFTSGVESSFGTSASSKSVKAMIAELIRAEDPR